MHRMQDSRSHPIDHISQCIQDIKRNEALANEYTLQLIQIKFEEPVQEK